MNEPERIPTPEEAREGFLFTGFPYVVTRVVGSLHHIILLPETWPPMLNLEFAKFQFTANRLPTCLVVAADYCVYFDEEGTAAASNAVPRASEIVSERLAPVVPVPPSADLSIRRMRLVAIEERQRGDGRIVLLFGDLTKGARFPTPDEELTLRGTRADGVPLGLLRCVRCGEWRGECFDTLAKNCIVRVSCSCDNDNRCGRCGELLYGRKLNANYFNPDDMTIWHVPGFAGLQHRCGAVTAAAPYRLRRPEPEDTCH